MLNRDVGQALGSLAAQRQDLQPAFIDGDKIVPSVIAVVLMSLNIALCRSRRIMK